MCYLGVANWQLGDLPMARELIEAALAAARASDHVPTLADTYSFAALLETWFAAMPKLPAERRKHALS